MGKGYATKTTKICTPRNLICVWYLIDAADVTFADFFIASKLLTIVCMHYVLI